MIRLAAVVLLLALAGFAPLMSAQGAHAARHVAGDATAGQALFQRYCVMCHAVTPNTKIVGPSLYSEMRGPHAKSATAVREVIMHGKGQMPALGAQLSEKDIADLLAYVRTQ